MKLNNQQKWNLNQRIRFTSEQLNVGNAKMFSMVTKIMDARNTEDKLTAIQYLLNELAEANIKEDANA